MNIKGVECFSEFLGSYRTRERCNCQVSSKYGWGSHTPRLVYFTWVWSAELFILLHGWLYGAVLPAKLWPLESCNISFCSWCLPTLNPPPPCLCTWHSALRQEALADGLLSWTSITKVRTLKEMAEEAQSTRNNCRMNLAIFFRKQRARSSLYLYKSKINRRWGWNVNMTRRPEA